ncbi:MAG TPA: threonine/serine dehydratase [Dehalococcoidia bacterium]|nr:threonine/serine dehydratase [Dehalococcoidia bacterium]
MDLRRPTLRDVLRARQVIRPYLPPTPLIRYPAIDRLLGATAWFKHENCQPVGAFKVRGGVYLLSQLSADERRRGVIAASTGNHGQSVAYAAQLFAVPAIVGVPEGANPTKVESMRNLGAEVIVHGRDFDAAREHVEALAAERGYRYVHSGDEPLLVAGVGTLTLEILEEQPEIDTIVVPVGGGSGAAAACIVAKAIDPAIRVIGVQSEGAPAAYRTWQERRPVETETIATFAEGLATRTSFAFPQAIMAELLDEFVLVSDAQIRAAIRLLIEKAHTLAEGAGAAPLAAALVLREQLAGRRVALVLSGGNLSPAQLREVMAEPAGGGAD